VAALLPVSALAHFSPRDKVHGSGEIATTGGGDNNKFVLAINAGPNGEQPQGNAAYHIEFVSEGVTRFAGPPECVNVVGNKASVVVDLAHGRNQPAQFEDGGAVIQVEDNGKARGNQAPVDRQHNNRLTPAELDSLRDVNGNVQCPAPDAPVGGVIKGPMKPIAKGEITVRDGG
jgi:hypothetical protein